MWFAAMSTPDDYSWTLNLVWKLLHNNASAVGLFAGNPFPAKPPKYIRAVLYYYAFAKLGNTQSLWWSREQVGLWLPAMSVNDPGLVEFLKTAGWVK